jgi:hypothetical protein
MRTRYLTNVLMASLGGFLLVTSQAFAVSTFGWLMFASGIATLLITVPAITVVARGGLQRALDYLFILLGAWTIVASLVFSGAAVTWLGFASGGALAVLALAGLTAHELSSERVVHSFELRAAARGGTEEELARTS